MEIVNQGRSRPSPMDDAQPSRRGRPHKEQGDVATDLLRARGRAAQKAFRHRKQLQVKALEENVSVLANVIEEMSNSFIAFVDGIFKSKKVEPELLKQTIERFLVLSHRASCSKDEEYVVSDEYGQIRSLRPAARVSSPSKMVLDSSFAILQAREILDSPPSREVISALLLPKQGDRSPPALGPANSSESGLSYLHRNHIWGIPANSSTDGTSAIPYILAGRDSFAACLYFETLTTVVRALRGDSSRELLASVFRYKRRYVTFDHILSVATRAMNMLLHGTSQDPNAGHDETLRSQSDVPNESTMEAAIAKEVASHGSSETEYLNTWAVERYLNDKWGLVVDSQSVRAQPRALLEVQPRTSSLPTLPASLYQFAPNLIPGFSHSEQGVFQAKPLVEKIIMGAVSLGGGPRWHVSYVDGAVKSFLRERSAGMTFMSEEMNGMQV